MLRSNRSVIKTAVRMMLVEGGCNDIIAEGCKIIHEALAAEMDDEELMIPDDSNDIVIDGPEPESIPAPKADTPSAAAKKPAKGKPAVPRTPTAPTPMTPEQIMTGRAKIMRLIQQRTPPDIPTLVRACIDAGFTASDLAALTGLGYHTIAKCKTGAVTSTVAERFQELFAFPRKSAAQEEA